MGLAVVTVGSGNIELGSVGLTGGIQVVLVTEGLSIDASGNSVCKK